jgi:hypothetical protein
MLPGVEIDLDAEEGSDELIPNLTRTTRRLSQQG